MTKKKITKKKSNVGRPTIFDDKMVQKLTMAFANGLTDREACLFVWIADSSLYNYCKEHPEFLEQKEALKRKPIIKAKLNIVEKLNQKDLETSKWYLERKAKDEFSTKQELDVDANLEIKSINVVIDE